MGARKRGNMITTQNAAKLLVAVAMMMLCSACANDTNSYAANNANVWSNSTAGSGTYYYQDYDAI
jgi:hypothetical protein